jgi:hypothetical protein
MAGNPYWISCETEGFPNEDLTPTQVQRLGELYAWGMREFGWPLQITDDVHKKGIGTHQMGGKPWGNHACPGPVRAGRRGDILAAASGGHVPPPTGTIQFDGKPTLRDGMSGSDVVLLQNALNVAFGHEIRGGEIPALQADGIFGTATTFRVMSLQRFASPFFGPIEADGICGPDTWRKLGFILAGLHASVPA